MKPWILLAAFVLPGCIKNSAPQAAMLEEDQSIVFPEFYARFPVVVGNGGQSYELDGVTLRALAVAANDYISPNTVAKHCWQTQEAQEYRVIRRGDIIFVSIGRDPSACHGEGLALDGGMKYAISKEGRILRRRDAGYPDGPLDNPPGFEESQGTPVPTSLAGSTNLGGSDCIPIRLPDGGWGPPCSPLLSAPSTAVDGGSPPDGGTAPAPAR